MNKTLAAGLLITMLMVLTAFIGPSFSPHGLEDRVEIHFFINEQGEGDIIAPPVEPSPEYPFGTDVNGVDLLTKLLYGAKYTVCLSLGIAVARVMIGGFVGMMLGYFGPRVDSRKAKQHKHFSFWNVLNGIPLFLIIWFFISGLSFNPAAPPSTLAAMLALVFVIVGLPSVVSTVREKTQELREKQFVLAAKSLGAGELRLIRSHLFPHLKETGLILLVNEMVLTLTLFGQLAIFNVFVGGTVMTFDPVEYSSRTNEWAGLVGAARNGIYVFQWILFFPLGMYMAFIVGIYLVSKGLESRYNQKYSKYMHL